MANRQVQKYGWRKDLPDPRDRIYNLEEKILQGPSLPSTISLRDQEPEIYDQGQLGSCTANAIGFIVEYQESKQGEGTTTPSRLFIYYGEREIEGSIDSDAGAEIRDGIKVVASEGAPPETDWPYDISQFATKPPQKAYTDAVKHEALKYQRIVVNTPGAPMRTAISQKHPIVFGFSVPDYFEDQNWDVANVPLKLPDANTNFIGGHATTIVGYDFSLKKFKVPVFEVRNSWGPDWGDAGHFWIDYRWFDPYRSVTDDLWVITLES